MNLKIYSDFDLNYPVAYFPSGNLYTFCMHKLTRKQPIRRQVLGDVISRSFFPDRSLTFCNISASCKWRDAQRAMRNRQFIGYTLGPLERNESGRPFDSEREAVKFFLDR